MHGSIFYNICYIIQERNSCPLATIAHSPETWATVGQTFKFLGIQVLKKALKRYGYQLIQQHSYKKYLLKERKSFNFLQLSKKVFSLNQFNISDWPVHSKDSSTPEKKGAWFEAFGANIVHLCKKWAQSRNNSTRSSTIRRFFSGGVQQSKIFEIFSKLSKTNIFIFSEQWKCGCQNWYDNDKILDSTIKSCIITGTACHYILPVVGDQNYKYRK